jgi:AcrR family transcriptional regulator
VSSTDPDPPRQRLSQAEARERTRRQLLAAAARVIAQKGYSGASLEEIAGSAGYSTGALYYHFTGKEQLFLELIETGWSRNITNRVDAVAELFESGSTTGDDPFAGLSRFVVQLADREREFAPLEAEFWLYAVRHPEAMGVITRKVQEEVDGLEPVIAAAMERFATSSELSPREMTTVAVVLFDGLVRRRRIDPSGVPDDLFARVLSRLFAR